MSPKQVFTREATGLVRELGSLEMAAAQMNIVVPIWGPAFTAWFLWYAVPGADVTLFTAIGYLFGVFGFLPAFAILNSTFPRAGAPYVAQSRVFHPSLSWPLEGAGWLSMLAGGIATLPVLYVITWTLGPGLYVLGALTGVSAYAELGTAIQAPVWIVTISTVLLVISIIPAFLGTRWALRNWLVPMTFLACFGLLLAIGVVIASSPQNFVTEFTNLMGQSPAFYVEKAKELYPGAFAPVSITQSNFLPGIAMTAGATNVYYASYMTGEMRHANSLRRQLITMLVPGLILVVTIGAVVGLEQALVGRDTLVALTQISTLSPALLKAPLFLGGFVTFFIPMLLMNNAVILVIFMAALIAGMFCNIIVNWLNVSRLLFAWSFDRLVPEKFAQVSDRFHTPTYALALNLVAAEILMLASTLTPYAVAIIFVLAFVWAFISPTVTCLACVLLPARKHLYALSPLKNMRGGSVIAAAVGLIGAFYCANTVFQYATIPALGFGVQQVYYLLVGYCGVFILYWVVRFIRQKQGIDVGLIFKEIPPE